MVDSRYLGRDLREVRNGDRAITAGSAGESGVRAGGGTNLLHVDLSFLSLLFRRWIWRRKDRKHAGCKARYQHGSEYRNPGNLVMVEIPPALIPEISGKKYTLTTDFWATITNGAS
jgi:hypothetical protein